MHKKLFNFKGFSNYICVSARHFNPSAYFKKLTIEIHEQ